MFVINEYHFFLGQFSKKLFPTLFIIHLNQKKNQRLKTNQTKIFIFY